MTFSVFFLNADKTIYARYATRSSHDADKDVALEGLASTMRSVVELHKNYPRNRDQLGGKQPVKTAHSVPEKYTSLRRFKSELDYSGQVAKSCIHCHQVRDAQRKEFRTAGKPIPEKLFYPYPSLTLFGVHFDKQTGSTIGKVEQSSIGSKSGLRAGDVITSINATQIASEADVDWILHQLDSSRSADSKLEIGFQRKGENQSATVRLPEGWRKNTAIGWRATTWDMRRMATGGMTLKVLNSDARDRLEIHDDAMALRADHVGRYGQHARALRAGIRKGDIIVSFAGRTDLMTESALMEYAIQQKRPGDTVQIEYIRNGKRRKTQIKLQ